MLICLNGYFVRRAILVLLVVSATGIAGESYERIPPEEARKLAYEAVKTHNPGADLIISPRDFDPDFYFFAATWPNPVGSPIIGYFAVNPETGDVWDARSCERFTLPSLNRLQEAVRKRLKLRKEDYLRLRKKKPMC